MNLDNRWVVSVLKNFVDLVPSNCRYFCIGSVALVSFTAKVGYTRKIKDIDIICENKNFEIIKKGLIKLGYKQHSFIDKKFPFYSRLAKLADSKYFRFEKNNKNLEIMTTDFGNSSDKITIELYPNIKFSFSSKAIILSKFCSATFYSASPETLFCIYNFGQKTWGRLAKSDEQKRKEDLRHLNKIIDKDQLKSIAGKIYLHLGKIKLKIPSFLIIK